MPLVTITEIKGKDGRVLLPEVTLKCDKEYTPSQVKKIQKLFADIFSSSFTICRAELKENDLELSAVKSGLNKTSVIISTQENVGVSLETALNKLVLALNADMQTATEKTMVSPITYDQTSHSEELAKRTRSTYGASELSEDKAAGTVLKTAASFRVIRSNTIELPDFLKAEVVTEYKPYSFKSKDNTIYEISIGGVDPAVIKSEITIFNKMIADGRLVPQLETSPGDPEDSTVAFKVKGRKDPVYVYAKNYQNIPLFHSASGPYNSLQEMVATVFNKELSALKKMDEELRPKADADAERAKQSSCWPFARKNPTAKDSKDALVPFNPTNSSGSSDKTTPDSTPPKSKNR